MSDSPTATTTYDERALINAMHDACIDVLIQPHHVTPPAEYFEYRLRTAGFLYNVESYAEILQERDAVRAELEQLRNQISELRSKRQSQESS